MKKPRATLLVLGISCTLLMTAWSPIHQGGDESNPALVVEYPWPLSQIAYVTWHPDSSRFAWSTADGRVFVFDVDTNELVALQVTEVVPVYQLEYSGKLFWSNVLPEYLLVDGKYRINVETLEIVEFDLLNVGRFDPIGFLPDSSEFLYSGHLKDDDVDRSYRTVDVETGTVTFLTQPKWRDDSFEEQFRQVSSPYSPDGRYKLTQSDFGYNLFLADLTTETDVRLFDLYNSPVDVPTQVAVAFAAAKEQHDLNADGVKDQILVTSDHLIVVLGGSPPYLGDIEELPYDAWLDYFTLAFDDLNLDGRPELILTIETDGRDGCGDHLVVYTSEKTVQPFQLHQAMSFERHLMRYEIGDFQGDTRKELAIYGGYFDEEYDCEQAFFLTLFLPIASNHYYCWSGNKLIPYRTHLAVDESFPATICCYGVFLLSILLAYYLIRRLGKGNR